MDIKPQLKPLSDGFRTDINGLRAWAVMAVVLYHFGVPGFQGGFVGVDIFFVISGFLMTGIIVKPVEPVLLFETVLKWLAAPRDADRPEVKTSSTK